VNRWSLALIVICALLLPDLADARSRRKGKRKRTTANKVKAAKPNKSSSVKCLSGGPAKRCFHGKPDPISDQLLDWSDGQRAQRAGAELELEADDETEDPLADVLAQAFTWPTVNPIELVGKGSAMSLKTEFEYTRKTVKRKLVRVISDRLRRLRGRSISACFAGPPNAEGKTDIIHRIKLAKDADTMLLKLLKVPEDAIKPYYLLKLKVSGTDYLLNKADLGAELFDAFGAIRDQKKNVFLSMDPLPRRVPAQFRTTTKTGKITIPAKVDGAPQEFVMTKKSSTSKTQAAHIDIKPDAQWIIRPGNKKIDVDQGLLGHKLLISLLMGKNKKEERETIIIKHTDWKKRTPTYNRDLGDITDYQLHAHGEDDLWFAQSDFRAGAEIYVRLGVSKCDVLVEVLPRFPSISIGSLSLGEWGQVSGLTVIAPELHNVRIGYMDAPYCGGIIK
jgi:hypothetical protein